MVFNTIKQSFSMPFLYIYKREIYALLASFGDAIMIKTDNVTRAIRNFEHIKR